MGLFCYIDRAHGPPQWTDCGIFLQTVMLLLREAGMDSCPQACWAIYHRTLAAFLGTPDHHTLVAGMSIGWKDDADPANQFRSERSVDDYLHFHTDLG